MMRGRGSLIHPMMWQKRKDGFVCKLLPRWYVYKKKALRRTACVPPHNIMCGGWFSVTW